MAKGVRQCAAHANPTADIFWQKCWVWGEGTGREPTAGRALTARRWLSGPRRAWCAGCGAGGLPGVYWQRTPRVCVGPLQVFVPRPPQLGLPLPTSMQGRTMAVVEPLGHEHMSPVALTSMAGRLVPVVFSEPQEPTRQVRPLQLTVVSAPVRKALQRVLAPVPVQVTPEGLLLPKMVMDE